LIGVRVSRVGSGPWTAGTVTFKPTLDGTPITGTSLDTVATTSYVDFSSRVAPGTANHVFGANDNLGCQAVSDASYNGGGNIQFRIDIDYVYDDG